MRNRVVAPGQFETPDLYLAAYLKTAGVLMLPVRWLDERHTRCVFVFEDDNVGSIQRLQLGYINNTERVEARTYADNIKALKSLCHI